MEALRRNFCIKAIGLAVLFFVVVITGYLVWTARTQSIPAYRIHSQQVRPISTVSPKSTPVVCIDPGHPSEVNTGRTVQNSITEVDMNWRIACLVIKKLTARGVYVVATKSSCNEFVSNRKRAEIANTASASLLVRLHCDTGCGSGYTCYYPDRQGMAQGKTGPSPTVRAASHKAAMVIQAGMRQTLGTALHDNGVKGESATYIGKRQGALTGSIFSQVPVVTVEMIYLSNPVDASYLQSQHGTEQMSDALVQGILDYVQPQ